jgi:hypothetical protein
MIERDEEIEDCGCCICAGMGCPCACCTGSCVCTGPGCPCGCHGMGGERERKSKQFDR